MDGPLNIHRLGETEPPGLYHTDTRPTGHKLTPEERALYESSPTKMVGRKFLPGNGDYLWEITEVSISESGWSIVKLHVEGGKRDQQMMLDDFMGLLKNGTVQAVDED